MRDVVILFFHLIVTVVRLARPGGLRSVVAESLLVKHQLRILNRGRSRAPNLRAGQRFIAGLCGTRAGRFRWGLALGFVSRVHSRQKNGRPEGRPVGPTQEARTESRVALSVGTQNIPRWSKLFYPRESPRKESPSPGNRAWTIHFYNTFCQDSRLVTGNVCSSTNLTGNGNQACANRIALTSSFRLTRLRSTVAPSYLSLT